MKISYLERLTLAAAAAFLAFCLGWFLGGRTLPEAVRVETSRVLEQREPLVLTAPLPEGLKPGEKIDLNTAGASELCLLPGIGEKRAREIVADRERNGPYRIPEDLGRVPGIGESTLNGLLDWVTTGEEPQ